MIYHVSCRLEQAEAKYRNRESRAEDLEAIENLKAKITEQEFECQKLIVSLSGNCQCYTKDKLEYENHNYF